MALVAVGLAMGAAVARQADRGHRAARREPAGRDPRVGLGPARLDEHGRRRHPVPVVDGAVPARRRGGRRRPRARTVPGRCTRAGVRRRTP
ncbi:hypothetical protein Q9Q99_20275 [Curtobacterium flaccumfaciens]|nr:hypothetical protein Q9Q99_20275 [Curtobacterium flaccumfaciens]